MAEAAEISGLDVLVPHLFDSLLVSLPQALVDAKHIVPELILVATFLAALLLDLVVARERKRWVAYAVLAGLALAFYAAWGAAPARPVVLFSGMAVVDNFTAVIRYVLLASTAVCVLIATASKDIHRGDNEGEFYYLLLAAAIGGAFLAMSRNLLMVYLNIEFLSLTSYVLAGFLRHHRGSAEAGLKYVIYGSLASGLTIFGMSYVYGLAGTTDLAAIGQMLAARPAGPSAQIALIIVLLFVFAGFAYKIAAVPFHLWSPDVYEGAPTVAAAFFSVAPKAAGIAALIRAVMTVFPVYDAVSDPADHLLDKILAVLPYGLWVFAFLSMTVGNLVAMGQSNIKRMLAYSSIAHVGYMLAGVLAFATETRKFGDGDLTFPSGPMAVLFYLVVYLLMNLGAFLVVVSLENDRRSAELSDLSGAIKRAPLLVVCMCIFLFSLTGVPPFAGFWGKVFILIGLVKGGFWVLAIVVVVNSVFSLFYYMRIVRTLIMDPEPAPETGPPATPGLPILRGLAVVLAAGTLYFGVLWEGLYEMSANGAAALLSAQLPM